MLQVVRLVDTSDRRAKRKLMCEMSDLDPGSDCRALASPVLSATCKVGRSREPKRPEALLDPCLELSGSLHFDEARVARRNGRSQSDAFLYPRKL